MDKITISCYMVCYVIQNHKSELSSAAIISIIIILLSTVHIHHSYQFGESTSNKYKVYNSVGNFVINCPFTSCLSKTPYLIHLDWTKPSKTYCQQSVGMNNIMLYGVIWIHQSELSSAVVISIIVILLSTVHIYHYLQSISNI